MPEMRIYFRPGVEFRKTADKYIFLSTMGFEGFCDFTPGKIHHIQNPASSCKTL